MTDPPAALEPESFADGLYAALEPVAADDEANDWSLLKYVNAIGAMFQVVENIARDSADGPGWSALLDLERCPPEALPWLGQFVGVRLPVGATEEQQRTLIEARLGWQRGTPAAIRAAAQATLVGTKTVIFRERDPTWGSDPPYQLGVVTYAGETPDPAATLKAIVSQKPAGIVLQYGTNTGQDYASLKAGNATYQVAKTKYPDYAAMKSDRPPS